MICDFFHRPQVFSFLIQCDIFCILHSSRVEYIFSFYMNNLYFPLLTYLRIFQFIYIIISHTNQPNQAEYRSLNLQFKYEDFL